MLLGLKAITVHIAAPLSLLVALAVPQTADAALARRWEVTEQAELAVRSGRVLQGLKLLDAELKQCKRPDGCHDAAVLRAFALAKIGRHNEAEKIGVELAAKSKAGKLPAMKTVEALLVVAEARIYAGSWEPAVDALGEAIGLIQSNNLMASVQMGEAAFNVATLQIIRGNTDDGAKMLMQSINLFQALGAGHQDSLAEAIEALVDLAEVKGNEKAAAEASAVADQVIAQFAAADNARFTNPMLRRARALQKAGKAQEAEKLYQTIADLKEAGYGRDGFESTLAVLDLADSMEAQGRVVEALTIKLNATMTMMRVYGGHPLTAVSALNIGSTLLEKGRADLAGSFLEAGYYISRAALGDTSVLTLVSALKLGSLKLEQRAYAEAEPLLDHAIKQGEIAAPGGALAANAKLHMAILYEKTGRAAQAGPYYRDAAMVFERVFGPTVPVTVQALANWAIYTQDRGDFPRSRTLYRRAGEHIRQIAARQTGEGADTFRQFSQVFARQAAVNWQLAAAAR
ncbi:tetratricopeptide repeat protein [Sphingomonas sp. MG17]|uniref:Tetratricopeptide repeat protein n=1 Tax=Sphingomonas tagetis TaxID=2949092 RepID=A0A9X2HTP9_9SPHN|nr:tetratricopeptide repeat protein [Sphingomonas tagetis]MCP3731760.1 tetratricopeptide repeat protein [Sphingomonas tagetis]